MTLKEEWLQRRKNFSQSIEPGTDSTYMEWLLERLLSVQTAQYALIKDYLRPEEVASEPEDEDGADPE